VPSNKQNLKQTTLESRPRSGKQTLNFWVDVVTAIVFAAMAGSGILQKWILPPGSRGGIGLVWLGQGRHFYGDIHFWSGIAMLVLVILHVYLHWNWVLSTWRRFVGSLRSPLTWALIVIILALIFLPLIIPRQYSEAYRREHEEQEEKYEQAIPHQGVGHRGRSNASYLHQRQPRS